MSTPINNRNGRSANVTSFNELVNIIEKAKRYHTDAFLVLNAKYYPDYVYDNIAKYLNEVVSAGVTRMIVCDLGMINYLAEHYSEIKISVSCLNQVINTMTVKFYKNFINVDRIVFPRHMSSEEIEKIVTEVPELEYEYFIFSNKCLYDDGYCRGVHEFIPICKDLYYSDFYSRNGEHIEDCTRKQLALEECTYSGWTRGEILCKEKNYCTASFACSACSLLKLAKTKKIVSVKLSIRGHGIEERLRQVQMAHEAVTLVEKDSGIENMQKAISKLYGKENLCRDGMSCMMI